MPDERKVSPGTPLGRLPSMSANWLNAVSDMLNWYRREVASGQSTGSGNALQDSSGKVKVKNLTGSDLSRGHYVQLGDYVPTTVNHRFQWYQGNLYDVAEDGRVAVIVSPTKQNEFREARILGKCTARVNVTDTGHRFAEPDDGAYVLKSAASGNIEILSTNKISGTGEQELTVILGGSGRGSSDSIRYGRVVVAIPAATSILAADWGIAEDAVSVLDDSTGEEIDPMTPITVTNRTSQPYEVDCMVELHGSIVTNGDCFPQPIEFWEPA